MGNVLCEINFDDYPCCTTDDGESSFLEVLYGLESILLHMLQRHTCVFFTMLELKIPSGDHLDEYFLITKFIESLERCFRGYKSELECLWVKEHSATGQHRYHLVLLLNGYQFRNAGLILQKATERWNNWLDIWNEEGLVQLSPAFDNKYGGFKIWNGYQPFPLIFAKCYRRIKSLAKFYCEGGTSSGSRRYDCSR